MDPKLLALFKKQLETRKVLSEMVLSLEVWIRRRVRRMSLGEAIFTLFEIKKWAQEKVASSGPKTPTPHTIMTEVFNHPLHKLINDELVRRDIILEKLNPVPSSSSLPKFLTQEEEDEEEEDN